MNKQEQEIDLMLECAAKVKRHLTRVLEERKENRLRMRLQYVNEIIDEADVKKKELTVCS